MSILINKNPKTLEAIRNGLTSDHIASIVAAYAGCSKSPQAEPVITLLTQLYALTVDTYDSPAPNAKTTEQTE